MPPVATDIPLRPICDETLNTVAPPRFDVTDPEAYHFLDTYGYVVIANVLDEGQVGKAKELLWEYLRASGMAKGRPETWGAETFPGDSVTGIIANSGFGHSDFQWYCRTAPRVKEAFANVWKTDELIVSFDGGNVFRPWRMHRSWRTRGGWYHVDQSLQKMGRHAVQGIVTLYPASEKTGGLVVIPGSHHSHKEVCERYPDFAYSPRHFVPLAINDPILSNQAQLVAAQPGDLILWDSRTVHCNTPAAEETADGQELCDLLRAVSYVCMVPRSFATPEVLLQRQAAFYYRQTCTHWPQLCTVTCNPTGPPNFLEEASEEQRKLIGC